MFCYTLLYTLFCSIGYYIIIFCSNRTTNQQRKTFQFKVSIYNLAIVKKVVLTYVTYKYQLINYETH